MLLLLFWAVFSVETETPDHIDKMQQVMEKAIKDKLEEGQKNACKNSLDRHHEALSLTGLWEKIEGLVTFIVKGGAKIAQSLYPKNKGECFHSAPHCKSAAIKITHGGYTSSEVNRPSTQQVIADAEAKKQRLPNLVAFNDCGKTDVFAPPEPLQT